jgi:hypothetical protein
MAVPLLSISYTCLPILAPTQMKAQIMRSRSSTYALYAAPLKRLRYVGHRLAARIPEPLRDACSILIGLALTAAAVLIVLELLSWRM